MQKLSEAEFKEMAALLRCPNGSKGLKVAEMMNATNSNMIAKTIGSLQLSEYDNLLEIGPSNGLHVKDIFKACNIKSYTGADISDTMIQEAIKFNSGNSKAKFILTNGETLPFEDNEFDTVFTVNTIYFWKNPEGYCKEIARVLKQGGKLTITYVPERVMVNIPFTKYGFTHFKENDVTSLLINAGFTVLSEITEKEILTGNAGNSIEREFVIVTSKKD